MVILRLPGYRDTPSHGILGAEPPISPTPPTPTMKKSLSNAWLPLEVSSLLVEWGAKINVARRSQCITQKHLGDMIFSSVQTIAEVERGSPSVQVGTYIYAMWALGMLEDFIKVSQLNIHANMVADLTEHLPQRVRGRANRHFPDLQAPTRQGESS